MPKSKNSAKTQPSALPAEEAEIPNQQEETTKLWPKNVMQMCHSMQSDCKLQNISLQTCLCLI